MRLSTSPASSLNVTLGHAVSGPVFPWPFPILPEDTPWG